jgi:hypothetical protein
MSRIAAFHRGPSLGRVRRGLSCRTGRGRGGGNFVDRDGRPGRRAGGRPVRRRSRHRISDLDGSEAWLRNGEDIHSIVSLTQGPQTFSLLYLDGGDLGAAWNVTFQQANRLRSFHPARSGVHLIASRGAIVY